MSRNTKTRPAVRRRRVHGVLVYGFLVSLCLPLAGMLWGRFGPGDRPFTVARGHPIAPLPPLPRTLAALNRFPNAFDAFYEDHFGYRQQLIRLNGLVKVMGLGVSPDRRVVIGKKGWLFLGAWPIPETDSVIQQVRGVRVFSPDELESWKRGLESRRDWLARRGVGYLFVIVPHKHSIYPEYLPDHVNRVRDRNPTDQLIEYLSMTSDVRILDLRPALRTAKENREIYRRFDTHWNVRGAWVGYEEIVRSLSAWVPDLGPLPRSTFDEDLAPGPPGDLARTVGLEHVLREPLPRLLPARVNFFAQGLRPDALLDSLETVSPSRLRMTEAPHADLPRAVMLHDSFSYILMPLLSEHFSRIAYLRRPTTREFLEHDEHSWREFQRLVEIEKPAVVIDQLVERNLVWAYRDYAPPPSEP